MPKWDIISAISKMMRTNGFNSMIVSSIVSMQLISRPSALVVL